MYKQIRPWAQTDAAYIGGLVDGEGTVTLSRRHRSENRQLVVSISNTERPLLEYVLYTVGAGKITSRLPVKEPTNLTTPRAIPIRSPIDRPWHC